MFLPEPQAALDGFQKPAHGVAVAGDLNLASLVPLQIDDREGLPGFVEDVLRHVQGALEAFGAQRSSGKVHRVGIGAGRAVGAVPGEGFHDVDLVIAGEAGVGCWDGREAGLAEGRRHGGGGWGGFGERPLGCGREGGVGRDSSRSSLCRRETRWTWWVVALYVGTAEALWDCGLVVLIEAVILDEVTRIGR